MGVLKPAEDDPSTVHAWMMTQGTILCVDQRFSDWFGRSPTEVVGRPFNTLATEQVNCLKRWTEDFRAGRTFVKCCGGCFIALCDALVAWRCPSSRLRYCRMRTPICREAHVLLPTCSSCPPRLRLPLPPSSFYSLCRLNSGYFPAPIRFSRPAGRADQAARPGQCLHRGRVPGGSCQQRASAPSAQVHRAGGVQTQGT